MAYLMYLQESQDGLCWNFVAEQVEVTLRRKIGGGTCSRHSCGKGGKHENNSLAAIHSRKYDQRQLSIAQTCARTKALSRQCYS